ncbi:hypothetical protein ACQY0O_008235 [Thecaphora frezii]
MVTPRRTAGDRARALKFAATRSQPPPINSAGESSPTSLAAKRAGQLLSRLGPSPTPTQPLVPAAGSPHTLAFQDSRHVCRDLASQGPSFFRLVDATSLEEAGSPNPLGHDLTSLPLTISCIHACNWNGAAEEPGQCKEAGHMAYKARWVSAIANLGGTDPDGSRLRCFDDVGLLADPFKEIGCSRSQTQTSSSVQQQDLCSPGASAVAAAPALPSGNDASAHCGLDALDAKDYGSPKPRACSLRRFTGERSESTESDDIFRELDTNVVGIKRKKKKSKKRKTPRDVVPSGSILLRLQPSSTSEEPRTTESSPRSAASHPGTADSREDGGAIDPAEQPAGRSLVGPHASPRALDYSVCAKPIQHLTHTDLWPGSDEPDVRKGWSIEATSPLQSPSGANSAEESCPARLKPRLQARRKAKRKANKRKAIGMVASETIAEAVALAGGAESCGSEPAHEGCSTSSVTKWTRRSVTRLACTSGVAVCCSSKGSDGGSHGLSGGTECSFHTAATDAPYQSPFTPKASYEDPMALNDSALTTAVAYQFTPRASPEQHQARLSGADRKPRSPCAADKGLRPADPTYEATRDAASAPSPSRGEHDDSGLPQSLRFYLPSEDDVAFGASETVGRSTGDPFRATDRLDAAEPPPCDERMRLWRTSLRPSLSPLRSESSLGSSPPSLPLESVSRETGLTSRTRETSPDAAASFQREGPRTGLDRDEVGIDPIAADACHRAECRPHPSLQSASSETAWLTDEAASVLNESTDSASPAHVAASPNMPKRGVSQCPEEGIVHRNTVGSLLPDRDATVDQVLQGASPTEDAADRTLRLRRTMEWAVDIAKHLHSHGPGPDSDLFSETDDGAEAQADKVDMTLDAPSQMSMVRHDASTIHHQSNPLETDGRVVAPPFGPGRRSVGARASPRRRRAQDRGSGCSLDSMARQSWHRQCTFLPDFEAIHGHGSTPRQVRLGRLTWLDMELFAGSRKQPAADIGGVPRRIDIVERVWLVHSPSVGRTILTGDGGSARYLKPVDYVPSRRNDASGSSCHRSEASATSLLSFSELGPPTSAIDPPNQAHSFDVVTDSYRERMRGDGVELARGPDFEDSSGLPSESDISFSSSDSSIIVKGGAAMLVATERRHRHRHRRRSHTSHGLEGGPQGDRDLDTLPQVDKSGETDEAWIAHLCSIDRHEKAAIDRFHRLSEQISDALLEGRSPLSAAAQTDTAPDASDSLVEEIVQQDPICPDSVEASGLSTEEMDELDIMIALSHSDPGYGNVAASAATTGGDIRAGPSSESFGHREAFDPDPRRAQRAKSGCGRPIRYERPGDRCTALLSPANHLQGRLPGTQHPNRAEDHSSPVVGLPSRAGTPVSPVHAPSSEPQRMVSRNLVPTYERANITTADDRVGFGGALAYNGASGTALPLNHARSASNAPGHGLRSGGSVPRGGPTDPDTASAHGFGASQSTPSSSRGSGPVVANDVRLSSPVPPPAAVGHVPATQHGQGDGGATLDELQRFAELSRIEALLIMEREALRTARHERRRRSIKADPCTGRDLMPFPAQQHQPGIAEESIGSVELSDAEARLLRGEIQGLTKAQLVNILRASRKRIQRLSALCQTSLGADNILKPAIGLAGGGAETALASPRLSQPVNSLSGNEVANRLAELGCSVLTAPPPPAASVMQRSVGCKEFRPRSLPPSHRHDAQLGWSDIASTPPTLQIQGRAHSSPLPSSQTPSLYRQPPRGPHWSGGLPVTPSSSNPASTFRENHP